MTNRTEPKDSDPSNPSTVTAFSSLRFRNFRLMAGSYLFSNAGWFVLYTSLSWLVLSLTGSPADVGLTAGLMFLPTLVLGMVGGMLADRYPKRRILLFNYAGWISLTGLLAGLTLSHAVQVWHVQLIASGLGIVMALCYPAQQAFVAELVGPTHLRNAISITSSIIQLAGLIGPAAGGLLINAVGPGWSFLITAVCYMVPLVAVSRVRADQLHVLPPVQAERGQLRAGLHYAVSRPDVLWPTLLVGICGMFTGSLSVTLAVYAKSVFDSGPGGYGLLSTIVAVGSLVGALISGHVPRPRLRTLVLFAALLSVLYILSAAAPVPFVFYVLLLGIGASTLLLQTSANSTVQLAAHGSIRGRIIGIYVLVSFGGTAIGGPLVGNIDQHFGPQAGMLLAGVLPGIATLLIAARLALNSRRSRRSATEPRVASPQPDTCGAALEAVRRGDYAHLVYGPWVGLYLEEVPEDPPQNPD